MATHTTQNFSKIEEELYRLYSKLTTVKVNRKKAWKNYHKTNQQYRLNYAMQADEKLEVIKEDIIRLEKYKWKRDTKDVCINRYIKKTHPEEDGKPKTYVADKVVSSNTAKAIVAYLDSYLMKDEDEAKRLRILYNKNIQS